MAGIGDYVHYHRSRYNKYGINVDSGVKDFSIVLNNQKNTFKDLFKARINEQQAKKLSEYYSNLFYKNLNIKKVKFSENEEEDLIKLATTVLNNHKDETHVKFDVDTNFVSRSIQEPSAALVKSKKITGKFYTNLSNIQALVSNLQTAIDKSQQAFNRNKGRSDFKELYNTEEELKNKGMELYKELSRIASEEKKENHYRVYFDNYVYKNDGDLRDLIREIQDFLKYYKGNVGGLIAGPASEVAVVLDAMIDSGGNLSGISKCGEIIGDLFDNTWQGPKKPVQNFMNISLDYVNVEDYVNSLKKQNKGFGIYSNLGNGSYQYTPTEGGEGTIDVSITPISGTELENIVGESKLNMSLKNYTQASNAYGVSIISSVPLEALLMSYFNIDFTNHYLNLIGSHPWENTDEYEQASTVVKYGAGLRGLAGFYKDNEVLFINIRETKTVYIASIYQLNQTLFSHLNDIDTYLKTTSIPPRIQTETEDKKLKVLLNGWDYDPDKGTAVKNRITKFLSELHKKKVSMSLYPATLAKMQSTTFKSK